MVRTSQFQDPRMTPAESQGLAPRASQELPGDVDSLSKQMTGGARSLTPRRNSSCASRGALSFFLFILFSLCLSQLLCGVGSSLTLSPCVFKETLGILFGSSREFFVRDKKDLQYFCLVRHLRNCPTTPAARLPSKPQAPISNLAVDGISAL